MSARKSTLFIVFTIVFIDLLGFGIVLPLLPRYGAHFQADGLQLGLLMASFSAMQFLFAPMWGALSDRIGRRPVLLAGLVGSTVSYALFGVATSLGRNGILLGMGPLTWLLLTRIGAGIAGATISTAQAVIADSTGAEGRGKGMALIGAAFGIGFTFGPLIGAACSSEAPTLALSDAQYAAVTEWSESDEPVNAETAVAELNAVSPLRQADKELLTGFLESPRPRSELRTALLTPPSPLPGYVASGLSALAFLMALIRLPETWTAERRGAPGVARRGIGGVTQAFRDLFSARFGTILLAALITTFAFTQFESTLSVLTRLLGYGTRRNFLLFAYIGFILMIGQGVLVRRLLPRLGEQKMAMIGVSMMVAGFAILAGIAGRLIPDAALWWLLPVITIGYSAVTPSLQSLLSQAADSTEQGRVLGSGQSLSALARILGPGIGLPLLERSAPAPFLLAVILMTIGGFQVMRLRGTAGDQTSSDSTN